MKKYWLIILLSTTVFGCVDKIENYKEVNVKEAKYLIDNGVIVIDVRTPGEVSQGKIKGALNIDFYSDDFENKVEQLDTLKDVLVYCKSGSRSSKSIHVFMKFDKVYNLIGGYNAWKGARE